MQTGVFAILLFVGTAAALCLALLVVPRFLGPRRTNPAKRMPYESGMDPIHDARRRFDFRFYLLAIAFLVFDVELLFLYPWAVTGRPAVDGPAVTADGSKLRPDREGGKGRHSDDGGSGDRPVIVARESGSPPADRLGERHVLFSGVMVFMGLLVLGLVYDWRKGVFRWR